MVMAALLVLGCVGTAAYIFHLKHRDSAADDSIAEGPVSVAPKSESSDFTTRMTESQSVPAPAVVDVNEQIYSFKQLILELATKLNDRFPDRSESLILLGNVYRDNGDSSEAIRYWQEALRLDSRRPDVYEGMGMIAMKKGEYSKAVDFWQESLKLNPQAVNLRTSIAQALMPLGRYDEALEALKEEIELYPASGTAHFLAGQVFLQKKDYEHAREEYLKVLELNLEYTNSYYGLLTVSIRLGEKDKAQEYREKFNRFKARDMQKLIDDNKRANDLAAARRNYAETAFNAAQIYEQYEQAGEATVLLDKATQASQDNLELLVRIAQWHYGRGRVSQSLALHEQISQSYPQHGFNLCLLGVVYAQLRRFDDSKASFMKSIEYSPQFPDSYRELARLCLRTRTDISQARTLAEKAVSLSPVAANYFVLSRACDSTGDREGAISALLKAIELDPINQEYRRVYDAIANKTQ
jgi:tetratricopeptide (TPR) repeat protein